MFAIAQNYLPKGVSLFPSVSDRSALRRSKGVRSVRANKTPTFASAHFDENHSMSEPCLMSIPRAGGMVVPRHESGDPFGLLLRERIVFLGNQVDDFTADAVISQLLLLDAQDPKKVWRFSTRYYDMRSTI
jgi:hypothetical protein